MRYIELIIFDLDGTLIDSRQDIVNAVNFTLKEVGLKEKSAREISSYIGTGMEDLLRKSLGENRNSLFSKAVSIFEEYYRKHSLDNSCLYPGVREVLEHFKNKRKAIVTNRKYESSLSVLKALGISDYFEDVNYTIGIYIIGFGLFAQCPSILIGLVGI